MVSVSTYVFAGKGLPAFAEELRRRGDTKTRIELYFDLFPFEEAALYEKELRELISGGRLGTHGPIAGCDLVAEEGSLLLRRSLDQYRRCLEMAGRLGALYMVVHTNGGAAVEPQEAQRKRRLFPERAALLAEMARPYGCALWVENVGFRSQRNLVFDQQSYAELILSGGDFYSLVDIGHARLNGWDIPALLAQLGGKIRGFHVHDNDGKADRHLPVFKGTTPWAPIFEAMRMLPEDFLPILEYASPVSHAEIFAGIDAIQEQIGSAAPAD